MKKTVDEPLSLVKISAHLNQQLMMRIFEFFIAQLLMAYSIRRQKFSFAIPKGIQNL